MTDTGLADPWTAALRDLREYGRLNLSLVDHLTPERLDEIAAITTNLSYADLSDTSAPGLNLTRFTLRNAELDRADLTGAQLQGCDLSGAALTAATLTNADLAGANLNAVDARRANLASAYLSGTTFQDANLDEADLHDVYADAINFANATLRNADMRHATFIRCVFERTHLTNARLDHTHFEDSDLYPAQLATVGSMHGIRIVRGPWFDPPTLSGAWETDTATDLLLEDGTPAGFEVQLFTRRTIGNFSIRSFEQGIELGDYLRARTLFQFATAIEAIPYPIYGSPQNGVTWLGTVLSTAGVTTALVTDKLSVGGSALVIVGLGTVSVLRIVKREIVEPSAHAAGEEVSAAIQRWMKRKLGNEPPEEPGPAATQPARNRKRKR